MVDAVEGVGLDLKPGGCTEKSRSFECFGQEQAAVHGSDTASVQILGSLVVAVLAYLAEAFVVVMAVVLLVWVEAVGV